MAKYKFTDSEDDELITLVSCHPILWDMADKQFKKNNEKDLHWREIAHLLHKTARECKTRWRSIKDHRQRQKKKEATESATKKRAIYWDRLGFLDTEVDERSENDSTVEIEEAQFPEDNENVNHTTIEQADLDQNLEKQENAGPATATETNQQRKRARTDIEQSKSRVDHIDQDPPRNDDGEIDLFFKAMAATVKKFSFENQVETKMKVFNVVNQMERKSITRKQS